MGEITNDGVRGGLRGGLDGSMAEGTVLGIEVLKLPFERLVLTGSAGVVLSLKDALTASHTGTEVGSTFGAVGIAIDQPVYLLFRHRTITGFRWTLHHRLLIQ